MRFSYDRKLPSSIVLCCALEITLSIWMKFTKQGSLQSTRRSAPGPPDAIHLYCGLLTSACKQTIHRRQ